MPDYDRDILTNYEIGWKTRFLDDRLQLNGAVFLEEWDDIQVSFQGANGITQVDNGPQAEVQGIEVQLDWLPTDNLRLAMALAYYDSELKDDYCDTDSVDFDNDGDILECAFDEDTGLPSIKAPEGTPLADHAGLQGQPDRALHPSRSALSMRTCRDRSPTKAVRHVRLDIDDNDAYGDIPSYTFVDLAFGVEKEKYSVELFLANATDEDVPLVLRCRVYPWRVRRSRLTA